MYSNVFVQAGNQDLVQQSMQPDAEVTIGMDIDEGMLNNNKSYYMFETLTNLCVCVCVCVCVLH